jgi:carboxyl-terminal processing protease
MALKLTVTNKGTATLYRLNAVTKSDSYLFTNKELVIGKLEAGKSKTVSIPLGYCEPEGYKPGSTAVLKKDAPRICKIPKDVATRADWITLKFDEARGRIPADVATQVSVRALERPVFAYSYQVIDAKKGNGDGRVQKGETITLNLTVKNIGKGKSLDTRANLRNLSGDGLLLKEGRFDLSSMAPGETRSLSFNFDVEEQLKADEAKVELTIVDRDLRENIVEKVRMPLSLPLSIATASGGAKAKAQGALLYESADAGSRAFGKLAAGMIAPVVGKTGEFMKVKLDDERFGFVRTADIDSAAPAGKVTFEALYLRMPPEFEVEAPPQFTREGRVTLKGIAKDSNKLLDAYIFVDSKKVFYRSNRSGTDPKSMPFEASIPLHGGINVITVVARETPETLARRTFIVCKDGPNGEYIATPKREEDSFEGGDDD